MGYTIPSDHHSSVPGVVEPSTTAPLPAYGTEKIIDYEAFTNAAYARAFERAAQQPPHGQLNPAHFYKLREWSLRQEIRLAIKLGYYDVWWYHEGKANREGKGKRKYRISQTERTMANNRYWRQNENHTYGGNREGTD